MLLVKSRSDELRKFQIFAILSFRFDHKVNVLKRVGKEDEYISKLSIYSNVVRNIVKLPNLDNKS